MPARRQTTGRNFYKVADTIIKNVQYEYLRDHGYGKKDEIIQRLQDALAPLHKIVDGQQALAETLRRISTDQSKAWTDHESLHQNLQNWQRDLDQSSEKNHQAQREILAQHHAVQQDLGSLHQHLDNRHEKLGQTLHEQTQQMQSLQQKSAELLPKLQESADQIAGIARQVQESNSHWQQIDSQLRPALEIIEGQPLATSQLELEITRLNDRLTSIIRLLEAENPVVDTAMNWQECLATMNAVKSLLEKQDDGEKQAQTAQKLSQQLASLSEADIMIADALQEIQQRLTTLSQVGTAGGNDGNSVEEQWHAIGAQLEARIDSTMMRMLPALEKAPRLPDQQDIEARQQLLQQQLVEEMKSLLQQQLLTTLAALRNELKSTIQQQLATTLAPLQIEFQSAIEQQLTTTLSPLRAELQIAMQQSLAKMQTQINAAQQQHEQSIEKQLATSLGRLTEELPQQLAAIHNEIKSELQPLRERLENVDKAVNRVDLRMLARENTEQFASQKVTAYCPHCDHEVTAPESFQGRRVLCRHCRKEFTFPTV